MTDKMLDQLLAAKFQAHIILAAIEDLIKTDPPIDTGNLRAMTDPILEITIFSRRLEKQTSNALDLAIEERGVERLEASNG